MVTFWEYYKKDLRNILILSLLNKSIKTSPFIFKENYWYKVVLYIFKKNNIISNNKNKSNKR